MQPTITDILESEKEVYCSLDTKLQRHGNCLSLIDDCKVFIVYYIHGKMDGTGYLLDHGQVLHEFVFSKGTLESTNSYSAESGVIDIDTGTRFEGLIYKEKPYGYGELFDDDGNKIYEGILINWKRCGYGISYNSNGIIKYDGYWFDNKHHGPGVKSAINGDVIVSGSFINNNFVNSGYSGDGKGLNSSLTHIELTYPTSLNEIRFQGYAFERISIANNLSCKIGQCSITNMPALCSLDIRNNCFTEKTSILNIENCPVLNSISIGENSFTKYSLKINNLPKLKTFESESKSFREAKLVIFQDLPQLETIRLGIHTFEGERKTNSCLIINNLPNLKTIFSMGFTFNNFFTVLLNNIPNLTSVILPNSFQNVMCSTMHSASMLSILVPVSHSAAYLLSLSKTLKKLDLPSRTCNEESYETFDVTQFTNLKSLTIGDISFNSVKVFVLENLPFLKTVSIGKNCFLNVQNADSKCFRIANCSHLKSFVVQEWSFQNCGGVIDISKLKRLKTIQIGSKDKESYNFMNASLHIHDLSNLESIELGNFSHNSGTSAGFENLPKLKSIVLGSEVLRGKFGEACSLLMKDLPSLETFTFSTSSLLNVNQVSLTNVPKVNNFVSELKGNTIQSAYVENVSEELAKSLSPFCKK